MKAFLSKEFSMMSHVELKGKWSLIVSIVYFVDMLHYYSFGPMIIDWSIEIPYEKRKIWCRHFLFEQNYQLF